MKPTLTYLHSPKPERWTARETDFGVELVCADPVTSKLASMFMIAVVLATMIVYLSQVASGGWSDFALLGFLLVVLYAFMVGVSNQTTIQITDDELKIHTTPLPSPGQRRSFLTASLTGVYCQQRSGSRGVTYILWLTTPDNRDCRALTFVRPGEAFYAREFISTYCGIEEITGIAGNASPYDKSAHPS